jgi:MFS family permease
MRPFAAVEAPPRHAVRRTGILLGLVTAPASVAIGAPSVALPTIASALHASFGSTAWVIAAWALGAAVSMPLMGRAAQRNGVRATLIAAAAMLTFGSVLAALGPSLLVIVIGRLIGGLGAGGTVISVYRYVDHVFTGADRTTALSIVAACVATTSGMGTLVGGVLTEFAGWRWTLAVPALVLAPLLPAARRAPSAHEAHVGIDVLGAALLSAMGASLITLLQAPTHMSPMWIALLLTIALLSSAALVLRIHRRPEGFVPRSVIATRGFVPAGIIGLSLGAGYYGVLTAAPHLLEGGPHLSALAVGVALMPAAAAAVLTGRILAELSDRIPAWRTSAFLGMFSATGAVVIAVSPQSTAAIIVGVALGTVGFAGAQIVLVELIPRLVPDGQQAIAQGLFSFLLFGGGSIGPALIGGLSAFPVHVALAAVAALALLGTALSVTVRPGSAVVRHPALPTARSGATTGGQGMS